MMSAWSKRRVEGRKWGFCFEWTRNAARGPAAQDAYADIVNRNDDSLKDV